MITDIHVNGNATLNDLKLKPATKVVCYQCVLQNLPEDGLYIPSYEPGDADYRKDALKLELDINRAVELSRPPVTIIDGQAVCVYHMAERLM